jgi:hypothetical protein
VIGLAPPVAPLMTRGGGDLVQRALRLPQARRDGRVVLLQTRRPVT